MSETLHLITKLVSDNRCEQIEEWLQLRIKPRPQGMSKKEHERLLKQLLVLEYFNKPPYQEESKDECK